MATSNATAKKPLWLLIEEQILQSGSQGLSGENLEASIQRIAGELDGAGFNVSRHGGNMIKLRFAVDKARTVGKPFLNDFNEVISALTLDDVADPYAATTNLIDKLGDTWPDLRKSERRPDVIGIIEKDFSPLNPSYNDMVQYPRSIYSGFSWHIFLSPLYPPYSNQ